MRTDKGTVHIGKNDKGQITSFVNGVNPYTELYGHYSAGEALAAEGKYEEAKAEFMMMIDGVNGKKNVGMAHLGMARMYEKAGDYAKAIQEYEWLAENAAKFARPEYKAKAMELKAKADKP